MSSSSKKESVRPRSKPNRTTHGSPRTSVNQPGRGQTRQSDTPADSESNDYPHTIGSEASAFTIRLISTAVPIAAGAAVKGLSQLRKRRLRRESSDKTPERAAQAADIVPADVVERPQAISGELLATHEDNIRELEALDTSVATNWRARLCPVGRRLINVLDAVLDEEVLWSPLKPERKPQQ
jgi:hypothetical protein